MVGRRELTASAAPWSGTGRGGVPGLALGTSLHDLESRVMSTSRGVSFRVGRSLATLLMVAGSMSDALNGQVVERLAILRGQVIDGPSSQPLPFAVVEIPLIQRRTQADSIGEFLLTDLHPGLVRIHVRHLGYQPLHRSLLLRDGRVERVTLVLTPETTRLPALVVEGAVLPRGAMSGFEERRSMGHGTFFGSEEIQVMENQRLPDILRRVPGLQITARGTVISARRNCPLHIIMDGQVLVGNNISLWDLPALGSYAGIEIYPGQASLPSQFRVLGSECGVLVLWSRRGYERRPGS